MTNKATILVVDDNAAILTAVKICLEGIFARVITLPKPDGMLTLLQQEAVSAILLDMNFALGVNSGHEGIMWLHALKHAHPDIPVVLMTAYADVRLAVRGLKAGAADFIAKPWDNEELVRILKDVVDKSDEVMPLDYVETEHVRRVVDRCHGNVSRAAEMLGITRQTLYAKLKGRAGK